MQCHLANIVKIKIQVISLQSILQVIKKILISISERFGLILLELCVDIQWLAHLFQ